MEKAVEFYLGYVMSEHMVNYLAPTIMSSVRACSESNTSRISRMLFNLAVEMAISNNLLAASISFATERYSALKQECEREVRRLNGEFSMDDALRWQRRLPNKSDDEL